MLLLKIVGLLFPKIFSYRLKSYYLDQQSNFFCLYTTYTEISPNFSVWKFCGKVTASPKCRKNRISEKTVFYAVLRIRVTQRFCCLLHSCLDFSVLVLRNVLRSLEQSIISSLRLLVM